MALRNSSDQSRVGGDDAGGVEAGGLPLPVDYGPAGFPGQDQSGGDVPGRQRVVEVQVQPSGGGIGQAQGSRSHQPHGQYSRPEGPNKVDGLSCPFVDVSQVAAQQGLGQF